VRLVEPPSYLGGKLVGSPVLNWEKYSWRCAGVSWLSRQPMSQPCERITRTTMLTSAELCGAQPPLLQFADPAARRRTAGSNR
jgi:hypothetical protein